ncbi:MAG: glycine cleavage system protein GcvH [Magnetococcales bacterium]|nr:glycine cleavage system protein GcvH [Magnetococcales bacterium]
MSIPANLKYTSEHEWVRPEGDEAVVGITFFAQDQLGDVVYVELPQVGREITAGQPFGVVESVKSVSELYAPLSGVVTAINEPLKNAPEWVNQDPYGTGWMIRIRPSNPAEAETLLPPEAYAALTEH